MEFRLPPVMTMTGDVRTMLHHLRMNCNLECRKYIAASIILGQPFNRIRK